MSTGLTPTAKAVAFYVTALLLALLVALAGPTAWGLYMLTPTVAVLLTMLVVTRDGYSRGGWARLGLHRLGWRTWGTALLVPAAVMAVAYVVVWVTGLSGFASTEDIDGFSIPGALMPAVFVWVVAQATLTLSLGEELGWRGYLLPQLQALGPWKASLLTGLLHGAWHLPMILLTTEYHAEGNRLVVIPLFLATITVVGGFLGYLRLRTDSVWPASIAHSAHNAAWNFGAAFTVAGTSTTAGEYLAGDSGLLILLGYAALIPFLLRSLTRRRETHGATALAVPGVPA